MKLWIRSQDRKRLTETNCIEYGKWNNEHRIYVNVKVYGKYKSEERALEVLDEIQNIIKPTLINTEYHSEIKQDVDKLSFDIVMTPIEDKITYIQPNVVVYEMPKE